MTKPFMQALIWLTLGPSLAWAEVPDARSAMEFYETAVRTIRSYDLSIEVTFRHLHVSEVIGDAYIDEQGIRRPPTIKARKLRPDERPFVRKERSLQVYQQGKGRVEILSPGGAVTNVVAYDGKIGKSHNVRARRAEISRMLQTATLDGGDYRETYRATFGGITEDLVLCLRERQGSVVVEGPTPETGLILLDAQPIADKSKPVGWREWAFKLALDPRRGMMPAIIEVFQPIDRKLELYRRMTVNEWKKLDDGAWVPIKATTQIFHLDPKNKEVHGQVGNEIVLTVDVARSSWNKDIRDELLRLPLPAGTKVIDNERAVSYVTGKADRGKNLADLGANAREVVPFVVVLPPEKKGWPWWVIYGSVALVVLIRLTVVALLVRKRRYGQAL
jgi:hypothetical protein